MRTKLTPFGQVQLRWAILLIALLGMLELAQDKNLALFYLLVIAAYFHSRFFPVRWSQPYWIIEVVLG